MPHPNNPKVYIRVVFGLQGGFPSYDNDIINSSIGEEIIPKVVSHSPAVTEDFVSYDIDGLSGHTLVDLEADEELSWYTQDDTADETLVDIKGLGKPVLGKRKLESRETSISNTVAPGLLGPAQCSLNFPLKTESPTSPVLAQRKPLGGTGKAGKSKRPSVEQDYPDVVVEGLCLSNSRRVPNW
ncbi:hypothetical protein ABW19_dt0200789 [Dactylella cylindrospora]|nr:hypothetical protein ABW19_dt0200789 [Dactylella cylindrospora]